MRNPVIDQLFSGLENLRIAVRGSAFPTDPGTDISPEDPEVVAPPWTVTGRAAFELAQFPLEAVRSFVPTDIDILQTWPGYTLGAVAFITYDDSPVGPYNELLVAPALVRYRDYLSLWVGAIDVDSEVSRRNGRYNWGLPKQLRTLNYAWTPAALSVLDATSHEPLIQASYTDAPLGEIDLPDWLSGLKSALGNLALPLQTEELRMLTYKAGAYQQTRVRFEGKLRPVSFRISLPGTQVGAYALLAQRQPLVGLQLERFEIVITSPVAAL